MRRKLYKHLIETDVFNTRTKIKQLTKIRKKKNEKRSWDNIKNKLKDEFVKTKVIAKETYQGIKKQINEDQPKKNIKNRKKKSIDLNSLIFLY